MIQGSRVGKLGTYCLIVLMVLETSLLPCLGPRKPEVQPLSARQSAGRVLGVFWNTKLGAISSGPYRRVLSRALGRFSHP